MFSGRRKRGAERTPADRFRRSPNNQLTNGLKPPGDAVSSHLE
ncbi:hypothetical protein RESH_05554 [Rhodopirellula europaea SH398]|uniref:Uncharacterized protein n=1 Tax=Rhodopirellula europaea SH398 TaxID=1263868 RepID=M5RXI5_9BACT|nr:hypothetical protein RESH_05554 [Rhodopirellula europaea SH398]